MNIIEQCREFLSAMPEAQQSLVVRMLTAPTEDSWLHARKLVVSQTPLITLEMAVRRISNQPVSEIPDPFTIYRALAYAVEKANHYQKRAS